MPCSAAHPAVPSLGSVLRLAASLLALGVLAGLCGCGREPPATAIDTVRSPSMTDPSPNSRANTDSQYYLRHDPF